MERNWWSLDVWGPSGTEELVQVIIWSHKCLGIQEDISEDSFHYCAYFQAAEDLSVCRKDLQDLASRINGYLRLSEDKVRDDHWETNWHKYFTPLIAGTRFIIHPPWDIPDASERYRVLIEPGQAFGSGQHETTQLMIELLEGCDIRNRCWLDLGCGSGILGICLGFLGADFICNIDIDPIAVVEARRNFMVNNVRNSLFLTGTADCLKKSSFNAVLANLNERILLNHATTITELLESKSDLLLSGFLDQDADRIVSTYCGKGLVVNKQINLKDWSAVWFKKP